MRRRLQKFFPVVLIALAMQILAPIAASWVTAFALSDPLGTSEICHAGGSPSGQTDQDQGTDHDSGCAICCVLQATGSLDTPRPVTLARTTYRNVVSVLTGYEAVLPRAVRIGSNSLARGPPQAI
jgi:hypothetical protein